MKLDIWVFFENLSRKFNFNYNMTRITGTLHEYLFTFMVIQCWVILRMRKFSDKTVQKIKTHILSSKTFFQKSHCLWNNVEKYGRSLQATDDNIIWRMRIACWIRYIHTLRIRNTYRFSVTDNNGYASAPPCYITCTLLFLSVFWTDSEI
jgi:hypothetical protein